MYRSFLLVVVCAAVVLVESAQAEIAGFNDPNGFTLNGANGAGIDGSSTSDNNPAGVPSISGSTLTLTTAASNEASSAFFNVRQSVGPFVATFTYQATGSFDGFAFVLENDSRGLNALGGGGGDLGYATDGSHPATPISPSAAVLFRIQGTTGFGTGGDATNSTQNAASLLDSGDPINVRLSYSGTTLTETLTDSLHPSNTDTFSYTTNLAADVGGSSAYIGFTGGTGGGNALQTITNFDFTTPEPSSVVALCGLGAMGLFVLVRRRRQARGGNDEDRMTHV
jgi:hypothetical protein